LHSFVRCLECTPSSGCHGLQVRTRSHGQWKPSCQRAPSPKKVRAFQRALERDCNTSTNQPCFSNCWRSNRFQDACTQSMLRHPHRQPSGFPRAFGAEGLLARGHQMCACSRASHRLAECHRLGCLVRRWSQSIICLRLPTFPSTSTFCRAQNSNLFAQMLL